MAGSLRSKTVLGIIFVVIASTVYYTQIQQPGSETDYGDVTVEQASELIKKKPLLVILDVRTGWEFEDGHIDGATNIPVDDLEQRLGELDVNDEMLVYCRTGNRSTRAVQILRENGFNKNYHMVDGIMGWEREGYPVMK